ncbi:MAG: SMC-Scp complex subunit ScpB [Pseudanabaenaceae cyanobacterium SKYGB_i_bin29]|nr:SMC-Scp complex subunit ScpB [Pseudanabaenaceae cyanobacterium SKYG29]MDW8421716.1 SMC-Scp complex subunit ScpB [Pseudanabaenaceae cyanobacterium SKYGB_i_bin29]
MQTALLVEAILYLKGKPLPIEEIAEIAGCPKTEIEQALIDLMAEYSRRETALEIGETNAGFCLRLRPEFDDLVARVLPLAIGKATLRTLAIIALKHPISQAEVVELRGSAAYQQIQELVEQGFVKRRKQSDGRSYWLTVTDKFHQYFEIDDLSQFMR